MASPRGATTPKKNRRILQETISMSRSNVEKENKQRKEGKRGKERKGNMHYRSHLQTSTDLKRLVLDLN